MDLFKKNPLFVVFLLPLLVDVCLTVAGQPSQYWSDHTKFNEALPLSQFLAINPILFIGVTLAIWLPATYLLVKKLKSPFNLWIAMTLFAGHSYNSVYWLRNTQTNLDILKGSLVPMFVYLFLVGYIASKFLSEYYLTQNS